MYLIDGYNLLYSTDFDSREELIDALDKFCVYRKKTVKIIFDGHSPENLNTNLVQVEFTGDADAGIAEIIDKCDNPSYYTLITSDKELKYIARQKQVKVIRSDEFNFDVPEPIKVDEDDSEDFFMTDSEVEEQLKEFGHFKEKESK